MKQKIPGYRKKGNALQAWCKTKDITMDSDLCFDDAEWF